MAIWTDQPEPIATGPFFLEIGEGFLLDIGETFNLLIEDTGQLWTDQSES